MGAKPTIATIEEEYTVTHQTSQKLHNRALRVMTSGIEHDGRYLTPFPPYMVRADKAKKWDVDGNEYIDLWSGHGALILGHNHPDVMLAARKQLERGVYFSGVHEKLIDMADMIVKMVPCAEKVRFYQSGLEAVSLAVKVARAYTGKDKVIKFRGHFHGYSEEMTLAVRPPFDVSMSIGVPKSNLNNVLIARHNHSTDVSRLIEGSRNDVACVILDPICHAYTVPNAPGFLEDVRQITKEKGVLLVFDEVFSGFRLAPGGAQEALRVVPDLACLAKLIGGGFPASCLAGRADIMDVISFSGDAQRDRFRRVISQGTHSGHPVSMAAGLASLKILSTGEPQRYINSLGPKLVQGMNEVIKRHDVPGLAYGNWSIVRIFLGEEFPLQCIEEAASPISPEIHEIIDAGGPPNVSRALRLAMLLNGVDYPPGLIVLNSALTEDDLERVVKAFDRSIARLKAEKIL